MPSSQLLPIDQDYWLTRDRYDGALAPEVDVWIHPPVPTIYADGDVLWLAPPEAVDREETYYSTIPLALARCLLGEAVPGDERDCLHVGV